MPKIFNAYQPGEAPPPPHNYCIKNTKVIVDIKGEGGSPWCPMDVKQYQIDFMMAP